LVSITGLYGTSMNNWTQIVDSFSEHYKINLKKLEVTEKDLRLAEKEYVFNNLIDSTSFSAYFAKKFKIFDYHLLYPINKSYDEQKQYILNNYINCKS